MLVLEQNLLCCLPKQQFRLLALIIGNSGLQCESSVEGTVVTNLLHFCHSNPKLVQTKNCLILNRLGGGEDIIFNILLSLFLVHLFYWFERMYYFYN